MISARTGIKLLRRLGIVLIALPEAVTTPFGVALLFASRYLSKRIESSLYERLRGTFQNYLAHTNLRLKVKRPALSLPQGQKSKASTAENPLILWENTASGGKTKPVSLVRQIRRSTAANTVHHTIDMAWLSRRYAMMGSPKFKAGGLDWEAVREVKMVHHNIDMQALSRRFETDSARVKTKHHTIDTASLQWRYRWATGPRPTATLPRVAVLR